MITASLRALARDLRERKLRAEALLDQAIGCYAASEEQLHAYMTWTPDRAMVSAKAADHLFAAGIDLGPWVELLDLATETGATFSAAKPITPEDGANDLGQTYHGPVVLTNGTQSCS